MKQRLSERMPPKRALHTLRSTYLGYGIWLIIILSLLISSFPASGAQLVSLESLVAPTFSDVPLDHWAYDYIEILYDQGYIAGCSSQPLLY